MKTTQLLLLDRLDRWGTPIGSNWSWTPRSTCELWEWSSGVWLQVQSMEKKLQLCKGQNKAKCLYVWEEKWFESFGKRHPARLVSNPTPRNVSRHATSKQVFSNMHFRELQRKGLSIFAPIIPFPRHSCHDAWAGAHTMPGETKSIEGPVTATWQSRADLEWV